VETYHSTCIGGRPKPIISRLLSEYEQPENAPAVRSLVAGKMQTPKLPRLSEDQVQNIAKALADPRRYEIIKRISRSAQPLACESVRGCLEITAPTLSHHMKELEIAGLITVRRSGKFINYEFRRDVLESFLASLRREFM
jgi:ArsR family transcriptional regulator